MKFDTLISKIKVAIGMHLFCHPIIGRAIYSWFRQRVPLHGLRFDLKTGNHVPYQQVASLYWGFYEKSERQLILKHLRPDRDVIDLGSGIGVSACFILQDRKSVV